MGEGEEVLPGTLINLEQERVTNTCELSFNLNDPGSWPETFPDSERYYITKMRLKHPHDPDITKSNRERRSLTNPLSEHRSLTKDWVVKSLKN